MPVIIHIHNPGPPPTATPEFDGMFTIGYDLGVLPTKGLAWQQDPAYSLGYTLGQISAHKEVVWDQDGPYSLGYTLGTLQQKSVVSGDTTQHSLGYTLAGAV